MKRTNKKLALNPQTIRALTASQLDIAHGGQTHETGLSQQGGVCPSAGVTLCPACPSAMPPC